MIGRWRARLGVIARGLAVAIGVAIAFGLGIIVTGGAARTASSTARQGAARSSMPGMAGMAGMGTGGGEPATAEGGDRIRLTPHARALARLRTTAVRRQTQPGVDVHLLGRVDYDETTLHSVTAWIAGRIDHLHVAVTGVSVRRGEVVATLYSPEVFAAQQDLLSAATLVHRLGSGSEMARAGVDATLAAARQRLSLLGISETEIEAMLRAPSPSRQVSIRTPFAGTVVERVATEGQYVQTGAVLYRLADLSNLWVQLDAYETDLPLLAVGQRTRLSVQGQPGEQIDGRIAFIDPTIDPHRRTARVRVSVENREGRLRPAMFVEAIVSGHVVIGEARPLLIPATAPLFTGRRSIVYVEVPDAQEATYQIHEVRLGPRMGESYPVIAGLNEGERIVTEGAFVLDADLQIRGGESMMVRSDDTEAGPWDRALVTPDTFREGLAPVIRAYLAIRAALAEDTVDRARAEATRLDTAIDALHPTEPYESAMAWRTIANAMRPHATRLATAQSIEAARSAFERLSEQLLAVLRAFGNPLEEDLRVAYCSMAAGGQGAIWVEEGDALDNPYLGSSRHDCGVIRMRVQPGGYAPSPTPPRAQASAASQVADAQ